MKLLAPKNGERAPAVGEYDRCPNYSPQRVSTTRVTVANRSVPLSAWPPSSPHNRRRQQGASSGLEPHQVRAPATRPAIPDIGGRGERRAGLSGVAKCGGLPKGKLRQQTLRLSPTLRRANDGDGGKEYLEAKNIIGDGVFVSAALSRDTAPPVRTDFLSIYTPSPVDFVRGCW